MATKQKATPSVEKLGQIKNRHLPKGETCTIQEASDITGISVHTLRYYDRQGIMPFLTKDEHGNRVFTEADMQWIYVVKCMKVTGFTLREMREYADLVRAGDSTLQERLEIFQRRREKVQREIERLQCSLDGLNYKCWYYEKAVEAGTEKVHAADGYNMAPCYSKIEEWEQKVNKHPMKMWLDS